MTNGTSDEFSCNEKIRTLGEYPVYFLLVPEYFNVPIVSPYLTNS